METPGKPDRITKISINLPDEFFYSKSIRDTLTTEFILAKKYRLSCERVVMYKNYYTYLYGLPMKLKDSVIIINKTIERKKFKGTEYLVLKATYEEGIGNDIWCFYFNPKTFAMEVYQFFHEEDKNDGEYILLTNEETINGIKIPKSRAWYTNKKNQFLGTDILMQ